PQLQQALADKVTEHPDHAEASQTAALLGEQTDLTNEALKGLILVGGEPGSPGQGTAVGKLLDPKTGFWDRIRDNYATFADTIQTALRSLKGDAAPSSTNRQWMIRLATEGKTLADSIPILQEISTSTHAGVQDDVVTVLLGLTGAAAGHADLYQLGNAVVGALGRAHAAPTDLTRQAAIATMVLGSAPRAELAKAVLASADASAAITAVAGAVGANQNRLVALLLTIPPVELSPLHRGNLHELSNSIVAVLGRFGAVAAAAPVPPPVGAPVRLTREATAQLVWNSVNQQLLEDVWNNDNARDALVAAAGGFGHVGNIAALQAISANAGAANTVVAGEQAKQESLVDLLLALPVAARTAYHGDLDQMSTAIVGSLGRTGAAAGVNARRTAIARDLVWNPVGAAPAVGNAALAGAVLANDDAKNSFAAAAAAVGGGASVDAVAPTDSLETRLKNSVGQYLDRMEATATRNAAQENMRKHYLHLHVDAGVAVVTDKLKEAAEDGAAIFPALPGDDEDEARDWFGSMINSVRQSNNNTLINEIKSDLSRSAIIDVAVVVPTRAHAVGVGKEWAWLAIDLL
ncbi:MAG: hypothetical protein AAF471_08560, partial [Myxococcota bacterium]